ncbi:hypothetical protein SAY87_027982 [Trapa incisa]|uniref:Methyltransferase type 11 domain-containing protein n=1 Tax=Trapa incisa TaxID=236973 RepID=A0AAN7KNM7_9MYRT|nr:hypothetical protein SAY87_027982 [Trapa incisa]
MDLKTFRYQILHGSIARRALLRILAIASALFIISLLQIYSHSNSLMFAPIGAIDCTRGVPSLSGNLFPGEALFRNRFLAPIWGSIGSAYCREHANLTKSVVLELMAKNFLDYSRKTLCAGGASEACVAAIRELGFSDAVGVNGNPFFSLQQKRLVYELNYEDNTFDFVLSRDIDAVSLPALLLFEIERVLKPGGVGAVLIALSSSDSKSLIRSATPVSSLLKASNVIHVEFVSDFTMVVFKKKFQSIGFFQQFRLPADCHAIDSNMPVIDFLEPLLGENGRPLESERNYSYLPNLIDISSRKRLVYIDIGAGEHLNSSQSKWFLPSYPLDPKAFNVYFVDHNTSVLLSYVKRPGVTFVYHPGLAGVREDHNVNSYHDSDDPFPGYEGFDFLAWFKETVRYADFVVLKMNSGEPELKFLGDLFESGAICFVDELFLHCSDPRNGNGTGLVKGDCMDMFHGLRSIGFFVHQWMKGNPLPPMWEDELAMVKAFHRLGGHGNPVKSAKALHNRGTDVAGAQFGYLMIASNNISGSRHCSFTLYSLL